MPEDAQMQLERALTMRERDRRDALVNDDMPQFASLLADDLVHVHATGIVHDKPQLLNHTGVVLRFKEIERGPLLIQSLGPDLAVMTGSMTNTVGRRGEEEIRVGHAFVTQLWVRRASEWQILRFHSTRLPSATPDR